MDAFDWIAALALVVATSFSINWTDGKITSLEKERDHYRDQLDACLNGKAVGQAKDVVLVCKGAEEIKVGKIELICPVKGGCA